VFVKSNIGLFGSCVCDGVDGRGVERGVVIEGGLSLEEKGIILSIGYTLDDFDSDDCERDCERD